MRSGKDMVTQVLFVMCLSSILMTGCGARDTTSEGDKRDARATVDSALSSETYDEFLACMSEENRQQMRGVSLWKTNWENLKHNGRPVWTITAVEGDAEGRVTVHTRHKFNPKSTRSYRLKKEDGKWLIHELAMQ